MFVFVCSFLFLEVGLQNVSQTDSSIMVLVQLLVKWWKSQATELQLVPAMIST